MGVEVFSACSVKEGVSVVYIPFVDGSSPAVPGLCFVDECDVCPNDFIRGEYDFCGVCKWEGMRHIFDTI